MRTNGVASLGENVQVGPRGHGGNLELVHDLFDRHRPCSSMIFWTFLPASLPPASGVFLRLGFPRFLIVIDFAVNHPMESNGNLGLSDPFPLQRPAEARSG
jgi:hypothetical protein